MEEIAILLENYYFYAYTICQIDQTKGEFSIVGLTSCTKLSGTNFFLKTSLIGEMRIICTTYDQYITNDEYTLL